MPNLDRAFMNGLMNPAELARALRESPLDPTNGATSTGVTREQYLDTLYSRYDQILGFPTGTTKELWADQHTGQVSGNPALDRLVNFDSSSATRDQKFAMITMLSETIERLATEVAEEMSGEIDADTERLNAILDQVTGRNRE
tara:strand:- start:43 stop:471 length:429 start_codon:yes stop_codon:yes gene_type:complete